MPHVRRYLGVATLAVLSMAAAVRAAEKTSVAVLPLAGTSAEERKLAEAVRFALSQKISRAGTLDRKDNTDVDDALSALMIPTRESVPGPADVAKICETLGVDRVIVGQMKGRDVVLTMYQKDQKLGEASATIPSGKESPKLTYEKLLTDLLTLQFAHISEVECDHSDPATEKRFAERPNLCPDPGFEEASKSAEKRAANWGTILKSDRYAPPQITFGEAGSLAEDRVAVVPDSEGNGHHLLMRMSKTVSENNGLACESTWIPVEQGSKYRFTVRYRSTGPRLRLFIKGFAVKGDQFGDKNDPEAVRREYYRFQVLPREKNTDWELIEADFNPGSLKPTDPKIQWIRVDLFIYLHPGDVSFDDVVVKKISP